MTHNIDKKLDNIYSIIEPKEDKIIRYIKFLVDYTKKLKFEASEETINKWKKILNDSTNIDKSVSEIKAFIDTKFEENIKKNVNS